ncbi:HSP20-like chaperone [Microthyrium microscopicum]|uniref:HSP20-like chaperone n=1 Tax=Microthyrium microscopicum TaxID=703497 RepID=A0A6A6TZE0_9PEZI|nr:HSP20-like chaperone [Microthyrium microscopicum]
MHQLRRTISKTPKLAKFHTNKFIPRGITESRKLFTQAPKMSLFFPRHTSQPEITSLFNLSDELERAVRSGLDNQSFRSFTPRFDIQETTDAYELHGELPGLEQENINIEWSDHNTLTISGQTEHRSEHSNSESSTLYQNPTMQDEGETESTDKKSNSNEVTKTNKVKDIVQNGANAPKYLITERSFGSFHRTFQFPSVVDQDAVIAKLKNGVLSLTVPKAKAKQPRRVQIN